MARGNNRGRKKTESHVDKTYEYRQFASTSATEKPAFAQTNIRGMNEARLKSMLQDPYKNAVQLAGVSQTTKIVNGTYKRIIKYLSGLATYDHTIYPVFQNPLEMTEDPSQVQLAFSQNAIFIDRLNPKFYLPMFAEKMFTLGATYQYKLEDSKGVTYQEIPFSICRIGYVEDGVYRFQVDLSKINDNILLIMPKEIQTAYQSYQNGQTDKLIEGKWYQVSEKGVAFTIDNDSLLNGGTAVPPLANALIDAIRVENSKANMEDDAEVDNTKIVHSKIETDDRGRPLMELPVVHEYHNALKRSLPKGAVAITNPFETNGFSLSGTGKDSKFGLLDKTEEQLYKGTGVSSQLFATDNSSSQALERSIQVDAQWIYSTLLPMFANYYNYELKKAGKKGIQWKVKFLQISHFDREKMVKTAKEQLSFGGSRLEYLAHCGMTPLEAINMLVFEQQVLNIDMVMMAKQTSHTMGSEGSEEAGRPTSDNPTDTTSRIKDQE